MHYFHTVAGLEVINIRQCRGTVLVDVYVSISHEQAGAVFLGVCSLSFVVQFLSTYSFVILYVCVCVCVCVCAFVQSVVDSIQCSVCANYFIFKLCGTDVVGLPELKKVVVVPYVKSAGEEAAFGNIKNGFVCATLQLAFYVTFICYSIYLLTAVTCAKFKIMLHYS